MAIGEIGALVLAAGRATRMGENKLLADLHGRPVVAHVVDAIAKADYPPPIIVTGHEAPALKQALAGCSAAFVHAADYRHGQSQSLRAGMKAVPAHWQAVAVCLGDMPFVPVPLLRQMRALGDASSILVPVYHGRRGNPVLWGREYFCRLATLEGDRGAKALLDEYSDRVTIIPCEDDGIFLDLDTSDALAHARDRMA